MDFQRMLAGPTGRSAEFAEFALAPSRGREAAAKLGVKRHPRRSGRRSSSEVLGGPIVPSEDRRGALDSTPYALA